MYFWVQVGLILVQDDSYGFKQEQNYKYMFIATLVAALSVTVSLIYLIFYSMSLRVEKVLRQLDLNFKYLVVFVLFAIFLVAEYLPYPIKFTFISETTLLEFLLYLTIVFFVIIIVLAQFQATETAAWWVAFSYLLILYFTDMVFLCSHQQFKNFYMPMLIILTLLCIAGIFVFCHFPERCCDEVRIAQLYFPSHFWFSASYLVLIFLFLWCLFNMFKFNEQLDQDKQDLQQAQ